MTSPLNAILPPCRFGTKLNDTLSGISFSDANRFIFRIHLSVGHGELKPVGFIASVYDERPWEAPNSAYHLGSREEFLSLAAAHINQYKDKTWEAPTEFISGSYSLPYVLFEALQRHAKPEWTRPAGSEILISIIDLAQGLQTVHHRLARETAEETVYRHGGDDGAVRDVSINENFLCPSGEKRSTVPIRADELGAGPFPGTLYPVLNKSS
ncbi:hypothetical protein B0H19DRAFT_1251961 [Mycena capillaripes]|nr:hypothetical protein B0H19DRAFT_1251961 [Mycena capillaripes]